VPDLAAADREFWAAVRTLPRRQAQVVALYYLEDRSVADVADILDMTLGTVKRHLYDARRSLARRLRVQEGEA
jgi:RNA polymerase sigma-70 factor (ECF subfamily)